MRLSWAEKDVVTYHLCLKHENVYEFLIFHHILNATCYDEKRWAYIINSWTFQSPSSTIIIDCFEGE